VPARLAERLPWRLLLYLLLAVGLTWPALAQLGRAVPGAARTDLANALWSTWFVARSVGEGSLPWHTALLDPPMGGTLLVADPLGALAALPLVGLVGLPAAYSLVVLGNLALAGWAAHRLAGALAADLGITPVLRAELAGLVAGVAYESAPILCSAVHNGSSEGIAGGWAALAAWACWRVARHGGAGRALLAAVALLLAALGSWYGAVVAFLFAGALALLGTPGRWRATLGARVGSLVLGLALVLPLALAVRAAATAPDNLVRIKDPRELMTVRRSTGPADLRGYLATGEFRSPDFRQISRYGEQFFHCHYLGWVLLLGAGLALRRRRGTGWLWLAGLSGLALSLGPVAVRDGSAWIILQDRAIPLPYLLVERLPGFSSLSLLYRLAQAPALAAALLSGLAVGGLPWPRRAAGLAVGAVLLEGRLLCPLHALPGLTAVVPAPALRALARAPAGVVLEWPVVGGRDYLYEQTIHQHPIAGSLNFPNNAVGMKAWRGLVAAAAPVGAAPDTASLAAFRQAASTRARAAGVRYVVAHDDPEARPDMQDEAMRIIELAFPPLELLPEDAAGAGAGAAAVRVYPLW